MTTTGHDIYSIGIHQLHHHITSYCIIKLHQIPILQMSLKFTNSIVTLM